MQTRRAFLFNGVTNFATFVAGGSLVVAGKEKVKEVVKNYNEDLNVEKLQAQESENLAIVPKEHTSRVGLPNITVNHATDFTLGGVLGLAVKKVIMGSIKLKRVNKELSSTVSKLQQLEKNDLPGIEKTLQEFVRNEGIRYEASKDSNIVESIQHLLGAILIHISSHNKAVQPFLEELQKLRIAFSQPFTEQLQSGGDVSAATKGAVIEVLRSDKLTEYLVTVVVRALQNSGAGEKIGKNTVDSLAQKDLISDDGVIALKQTITSVFKSNSFLEALTYAISTEITEYDTADRLVKALLRKFKNGLQDNDPDLVALRNALATALKSEGVSEKLNAAVCNAVADPTIAKELVTALIKFLGEKS